MRSLLVIFTLISLTGCSGKLGPSRLPEDSMNYNHALQKGVNSQLLLNIVRLKYLDNPTFLQVGVISASYDFKKSAGAEFKVDDVTNSSSKTSFTPKFLAEFSEKPTTTYSPMRGDPFVKELLTPISLESIALLSSSGWTIDRIMRCCVQRVNHLKNAPNSSGPTPKTTPEFRSFLAFTDILREMELNDGVQIEKRLNPENNEIEYYLSFDRTSVSQHLLQQFWEITGVTYGVMDVQLIPYHGARPHPDAIVIDTRPPMSMLYYLSEGVQVPRRDKLAGNVVITRDPCGMEFNWQELLEDLIIVYSGEIPKGMSAAVCICYRGTTFWIADNDLETKATFSMLTQILALQSGTPQLPYLTLPLN